MTGRLASYGTNLLLGVLASGAGILSMSEDFWWWGGAASTVAAGLVIWVNWCRPYLRERRMRRPFRVLMVRPPGETESDMVNELTAPPDAELSIQLRIDPRLHYEQQDIVFGFVGDKDRRPVPIRALNEFIKAGKRRDQSPENSDNHFLDENDNYHIREQRFLTKSNCYRYGYLVQTREPGCYPIRLEVVTECGEGLPVNGLFLIVEARKG